MSPELRRYLKTAIDARVRELTSIDNRRAGTCGGCGEALDDLTPGCWTCENRHKRRRGNPCHYRRQHDLNEARRVARRARWRLTKARQRENARQGMSEPLQELRRAA